MRKNVVQGKLNFMFQSLQIANHVLHTVCFVPLRHPKPKRFPYKSVRTSTVRKLNSCAFHKNVLRASDEKKRDFHRKIALKKEMRLVFG